MRTRVAAGLLVLTSLAVAGEEQVPAPPINETTARYEYQEVVKVDGVTASELHSRARSWAATAYRSAKAVTDLDDASAGRLVVKGTFPVKLGTGYLDILHTWTIETKDGRYRYTLTDFQCGKVAGPFDYGGPCEEFSKHPGQRKTPERIAATADVLID